MPLFSIISPVYRAENIIPELVKRITNSMDKITDDFEIILIEDGGPDNSWQAIENQIKINPKVKGVKLSRNFGQHHAITAGLDIAKGEWIVVMDCDLQDQPEEIEKLYNKAKEGYDIVYARRKVRQDGFLKKLSSSLFYKVYSYLSGFDHDGSIANFGIYSRGVVDAIKNIREPYRAFLPMVKWVGFNSTAIDVTHAARFEGESTYNLYKLLNLALNVCLAYSQKPLKLAIITGFAISSISFIVGIYFLISYLYGNILVSGFTSLIVSIWFLSGLILIFLGIIGLYIAKIFEGVKSRPLYIIEKIS